VNQARSKGDLSLSPFWEKPRYAKAGKAPEMIKPYFKIIYGTDIHFLEFKLLSRMGFND
jgi:hypothetical protein